MSEFQVANQESMALMARDISKASTGEITVPSREAR